MQMMGGENAGKAEVSSPDSLVLFCCAEPEGGERWVSH